MPRYPPICLTAPTACGKTELALALAKRLPIEIVSMDSAMVYRGMDIGTAKPSSQVLADVPHHLVDILEPSETYSAGRFAKDARRAIADVQRRDKLPLLVGGTLLYLRALRDGLAPLPARDKAVRAALDADAEKLGWVAMHTRLAELDPKSARSIAPQDKQRVQRALEVHAITGQPLSVLQEARAGPRLDVRTFALVPGDRSLLAERIEGRFDAMIEAGFVDEVRALMARADLDPESPSMRSVGYRQIWAHLDGRLDWGEARRGAIVATRQLAKRQMTWLRSETGVERMPAWTPDLVDEIVARIRQQSE